MASSNVLSMTELSTHASAQHTAFAGVRKEYHTHHSQSLSRNMEMLVFGQSGARVIAFPTAMGRFHDWEDHGLIAALRQHLEKGWIQLFCVDSVDGERWCEHDWYWCGILWGKNIWHALRIWNGAAQDWPCWAQMLTLYIGGHD